MRKNPPKNKNLSQKQTINSYQKVKETNYYTEEVRISWKKIRKIGLKNFSLSGNVVSIKRNDAVSFESSLERDYIHTLEYDKNVSIYYEQPFKIRFLDENKKRTYTPDFYVKYNDDRFDEVVEIKYKIDLEKNKHKLKSKFQAAKIFCAENDLNFTVLNEEDIRTPYLNNIKFLLRYKNIKQSINFDYVDKIIVYVRNTEEPTPSKLLNLLAKSDYEKATLVPVLWFMLSNNLINADLSIKLTMNSIIWLS